jgi:hypothetical protein
MPRRFPAFLVLLAAVVAACSGEDTAPVASPSPSASTAPISLLDALPSPTPNRTLPSMPTEVAGAFVFFDDFEKGAGRWAMTGGAKGVGWHHLKAATCGGLYTMLLGEAKNPATTFAAAESFLVLKAPLDLTKARAPQLQFDLKGETSPPEAAVITAEAREPGGPWMPLTQPATARFQLVVTYTADLTPYAGKRLELRFRGVTKPAKRKSKGFYLDDVHVVDGKPV